jgi:hypothetical protein
MTFHIRRTKSYLDLVLPVFPSDEDDPNRQFLMQTIVLMIHTFMEEFFRCVVSIGTFWSADEVRGYLAAEYPKEAEAIDVMNAGALMRRAQREVSYGQRAAKLKGILGVLRISGPYSADWVEVACSDLIAVRNIITHQGGWPSENDVPKVTSPHVFVANESGPASVRFYRLRIGNQFIVDVLAALLTSTVAIEASIRNDQRYVI